MVLSLTGRVLKPSLCLMTCCLPPLALDGWVSIILILVSSFKASVVEIYFCKFLEIQNYSHKVYTEIELLNSLIC